MAEGCVPTVDSPEAIAATSSTERGPALVASMSLNAFRAIATLTSRSRQLRGPPAVAAEIHGYGRSFSY
jgi:hypothetical protein